MTVDSRSATPVTVTIYSAPIKTGNFICLLYPACPTVIVWRSMVFQR